jgi:outer membrane receptor protein involved in Fe transport
LRAAITDRLEASVSALGQTSELDGWPAAYVPLPGYLPLSYTLDRDRDVQEYTKDRWGLGALVLKYNGDALSIISSTSYFNRRVEEQADSTEGADSFLRDAFGVDLGSPPIAVINLTRTGQFTQETRLAFDKGAIVPGLSGVFGVFYQRENVSRHSPDNDIPALRESGLYEPGYLGAYTSHGLETQTALFGEVYYEVVPELTVSLGLRQYWIRQSVDEYPVSGLIVGGDALVPAIRNKDSGAVPKAVVSYEIGDRGTLYASAAKGFRVGGAQQELPDICDQDLTDLGFSRNDTRSFKPDNLWSYEVGAKNNFSDGSIAVSAAAFQIDWNQIQQKVVLPACTFSFIGNAGKARIRGVELELSGRPIADVPLTLQMGIGYSHGVLVDPGLIPQPANTRLVQVPEWTPSISAYYEVPISNSARLFAAADYGYTSSVKVADGQRNFVTRQPFNIINGNIGVRFGATEIRAYVRNLLDKRLNYGDLIGAGFERQELLSDGTYQRYPEAAVSRPRQIGVQVRMQF